MTNGGLSILSWTKTYKKLLILSLTCTSVLSTLPTVAAQEELSKTPNLTQDTPVKAPIQALQMPKDYPEALNNVQVDGRSYVVVDQETNKILMEKEGNVAYPIASMSKVLSMYLIYQAIEQGKLKEDEKIVIPDTIVQNISSNPDLSNVGLESGVEYSVKDLMNGIMLSSGNDATSALMWKIYGSEQEGVKAIRHQLDEWGIDDYSFYSTSGVPVQYLPQDYWIDDAKEGDENKLSASDMALVAKYTIEKYPQILDITSQYEYTFMAGTPQEKQLVNPSELLDGKTYGRKGMTGLKSGLTDGAGRCYVATGTENGRKVITVLMGAQESSYPGIYTLLDTLSQYPDLYKKDGFSINKRLTKAEKEAAKAKADEKKDGKKELKNQRDTGLTKLMRDIFKF
ncbi:D-alanyl-D-alanine carboxypeptidase family protein [Vaginisenegalia massiliensis]|uniref:D-alanyl-D-alanine carboxypeptidase family protein n=1 Tax=Vaginisenegalia massiliensis TaxID=2058294 RepID=UPI000F5497B2|nr:serine hydrolase [Vaginisenegalia massiliensis]